MTDLAEELRRLGLSEYTGILVAEGFDAWETVLDITESDLKFLNIKIDHRRKLKRAIAESRGRVHSYCPPTARTKRKYRRHPKPDEHAPERPPSAYVIFSNNVRESLKDKQLSFAEMAKIVGERWQVLPAEAREGYQRQADGRKEIYYAKLAEYKKTPASNAYQNYLEEFKAKHAPPWNEDKHSKLKTQTKPLASSGIHEYGSRWPNRKVGSVELNPSTAEHRQER